MALRPGDLNRKLMIQSAVSTSDGGGGRTTTWVDLASVWAQVAPTTGGESFRLGVERSTQFYRIAIRFRTDVTPANRLLLDGAALNIRSCGDPDGQREQLQIIAESGSADG